MKKLAISLCIAMMLGFPIASYSETNDALLDYKDALANVTDTYTMYTTTRVNVRTGASTDYEIKYTYNKNTAVDAICNVDGWTTILGEDGNYYFISSQYLSEIPKAYTDDDLYVLSHMISAEMGGTGSWEDMLYTGSVAINRVNSNNWPHVTTLREAIFDKRWGVQYACVYYDKHFFREPEPMAVEAAIYLLENGSQIPSNVEYQSGRKLGREVWKKTPYAYYCYA